MAAIFQLNKSNLPQPSTGTKVLKAAEAAELRAAAEIITAAEQRAEKILYDAQKAYQTRYEQGYADGVEAGKLENAEKVMETVLASVEFIEGIENTVVNVVSQSIRKIIGEMDDEERIRRIVGTALSYVRGQQRVTVRVSPQDEPAVSKSLAAMTSGAYLNVVADPRLAPSSCILESDLGVIDASLETQLKALEHAFASKIRQ